MRDIPDFITDYGTAGLVLNQIPYTGCAYIHIFDVNDLTQLLAECASFCVACGAQQIFASGQNLQIDACKCVQIISMRCDLASISETDASVFPVTEETLMRWLEIYHQRMASVDNAAYISVSDGKKMVAEGGAYFVHRNSELLGIGKISGNVIDCIASVVKGSGADVLSALAHTCIEKFVSLEVASTNLPAIRLYEKVGFVATGIQRDWFQIL